MGALPGFLARRIRDPVYANGMALVLNAGLSSLLGFAFWMVAARRFPADALGVGAAVVSAATLAALLGKAGFDAALIRYAPASDRARAAQLLRNGLLCAGGLTLAVSLAVWLLATAGIEALAPLRQPAYAAGFILLAVGTALAWILDAYYVSEQRATVVLLRNVAFNAVKLVVPFVLVVAWAGRAVPLAWGLGLAASLVVAIALVPASLRRHRGGAPAPEGATFGYAMRNYALNLSEFLPGLILPILVLHGLGAEANARFYLAWTIATVAFLASKAIAQSAFAALVRDGDALPAIRKALALSAVVLAPIALVCWFGADLVLGAFGESYSRDGARLLRLLAVSIVPVAITNVYLALLKARDAGWELTLLPATSLAILLPAMPLALAWGGIEGAGLAWLLVQTAVGLYAAARLLAKLELTPKLWRIPHGIARLAVRRRAYQG